MPLINVSNEVYEQMKKLKGDLSFSEFIKELLPKNEDEYVILEISKKMVEIRHLAMRIKPDEDLYGIIEALRITIIKLVKEEINKEEITTYLERLLK